MKTHSGSCLCGQVSYVVRGEPENQGHCHCVACKKATSAPFATLVYYKEENFEKKSGQTSIYKYISDRGNTLIKEFLQKLWIFTLWNKYRKTRNKINICWMP